MDSNPVPSENLLRHLQLSPQLLEVCVDDPEQLAKLHRVQRAVLADVAVRKMLSDPNTTVAQFSTMIEALRKAEESGKPARNDVNGSGNGFLFQIILPNSGEQIGVDTRPPIEGKKA